MTVAEVWLVLASEVRFEGFFSFSAIALRCACADLPSGIEDDPVGGSVAALSEVQSWRGGWARHFSLMVAMAASVVKSLPAMRSITSRPRAASRRNPDAVIAPPGKATAAA